MDELLDLLFGETMTYPYPYPGELPDELERWHLHTVDQGHCIAVAIASLYQPGTTPDEFLVPIPVRAVQRIGYEIRDGYVLAAIPYDSQRGVVLEDLGADLEFR